jgi:DNA-binding NarL/FixJ family response regulator
VGELSTAASLYLIAHLAPDIIILDCAAPQINPLVVLPQLRAHTHAPQIITLGATNTAAERSLLRALGATAYSILEQPGSLIEALEAVRADKGSPALARPTARLGTRSTAERAQRHSRHA